MSTLVLEWVESNGGGSQTRRQNISDTAPTKNPGSFRIGRDRSQCDLEISHNTVSRLHIEILFSERQNSFFVRNLAPNNAPLVDGQFVVQRELPLRQGSTIILGQMVFEVISIEESLAATVVVAPPLTGGQYKRTNTSNRSRLNQVQVGGHKHEPHYGLECPKCRKTSDYSYLNIGCRWCGTSLGSAGTVLLGNLN
jgi:predicted component of type VI protein secretion system